MASQPVFGADDRVTPPNTQLPEAIRNEKDPVKIAAYYQQRENSLREEMRRTAQPPPNSRVTITTPTDDATRLPSATFSPAEAEAARETLIRAAREASKVGKTYWSRLEAAIDEIMSKVNPADRVDARVWDTAYNTVVGMNVERLNREDRESAETASRVAAERSSHPVGDTQAPPPLPIEVTSKILPGLGLSEAQYRQSQDRVAKGEWPLTAENVTGKRVQIGDNK